MLLARIEDNYTLGVTQAEVPALPPKGALIQVIGCGICGSDLDKINHQKASPGSVLGHEIVGIIEALDDDHPSGWKLGDRIVAAHHVPCLRCHYCLNDNESMCRQFKQSNLTPGGFSQYVALSEQHLKHTTFVVPRGVDSAEASCVEPLACVLRAVRRGGFHVNGSAVIIGLGFIGQMAAQIYQNNGYAVYGTDRDPSRIALAMEQGFVMDAVPACDGMNPLKERLRQHLPVEKVDTVFLSVVNNQTLTLALELVRDGGQLVLFTSGPDGTQIDSNTLYFREINIVTSYSPALEDLKEAARMIFEHEVTVSPLISNRLDLADIQTGIELYRSGAAIKVFIQMSSPHLGAPG